MSVAEEPAADYDRVVIGAGIIGSCTAYQLLQAGHRRVLLMDQVRTDRQPHCSVRYADILPWK